MESKRIILVIAAAVAASIVIVAVASWFFMTPNEPGPIVGGDGDKHGCIGSAGYSWCEVKGKCIRIWEEKCELGPVGWGPGYNVVENLSTACRGDGECETPGSYLIRSNCPFTSRCIKGKCAVVCPIQNDSNQGTGALGGDRDKHGCIGSAGYSWCLAKQKCLRTWEENCTSPATAERKYIGNGTEICSRIRFRCETGFAPFFDDTGCGCEKEVSQTETHTCTPAEKANNACTLDYNPVCGWFDGAKIQCFAYPCAKTYGNGCGACADDKVSYWTRGECPKTGAGIASFDDCVSAGNPVMESMPRKCSTNDGRTFVEDVVLDVQDNPAGGAGLANPASVYCEQQGGKLRITDTPEGQIGMCKLPSGEECEEWAYMRGICGNVTVQPADEASCKAAGGLWTRGMLPNHTCSMPASDYLKPCRSNGECEGLCKADATIEDAKSGAYAGKPLRGSCSQYRTNFGCIPVLENGELTAICID